MSSELAQAPSNSVASQPSTSSVPALWVERVVRAARALPRRPAVRRPGEVTRNGKIAARLNTLNASWACLPAVPGAGLSNRPGAPGADLRNTATLVVAMPLHRLGACHYRCFTIGRPICGAVGPGLPAVNIEHNSSRWWSVATVASYEVCIYSFKVVGVSPGEPPPQSRALKRGRGSR